MAIYDRASAAERVGRDVRTIRRWEERGWLTFTLGRVREADLLAADLTARENKRRGGRRGKVGPVSDPIELGESSWPEGAIADGRVYSLEITRRMTFDVTKADAGEDPWVPVEPHLIDPPFEVETMTGTYDDVSRRAVHLNAKLNATGVKAFLFYPTPVEAQGAR